MQQSGSPEALLATIAQSGDEVTQGWMRLLSSAAGDTRWLSELERNSARFGAVQAAYFEKQMRLWSGLLSGDGAQVAAPTPGDRRFAGKEWRDNPYFSYLRQSYLLASSYLEELVESCELEPVAKELGLTTAKVQAALDKFRQSHEAEHQKLEDAFASKLAAKLNIDVSKVESALEEFGPHRHP